VTSREYRASHYNPQTNGARRAAFARERGFRLDHSLVSGFQLNRQSIIAAPCIGRCQRAAISERTRHRRIDAARDA
jgi:hypothetical protein